MVKAIRKADGKLWMEGVAQFGSVTKAGCGCRKQKPSPPSQHAPWDPTYKILKLQSDPANIPGVWAGRRDEHNADSSCCTLYALASAVESLQSPQHPPQQNSLLKLIRGILVSVLWKSDSRPNVQAALQLSVFLATGANGKKWMISFCCFELRLKKVVFHSPLPNGKKKRPSPALRGTLFVSPESGRESQLRACGRKLWTLCPTDHKAFSWEVVPGRRNHPVSPEERLTLGL